MKNPARTWSGLVAMTALVMVTAAPVAQAQDFFQQLFGGGFGGPQRAQRQAPMISMPFANEGEIRVAPRQPRVASGGGQAYCVRTCDGRYFPIAGSDRQSRAESCNSFCPASPTKVFYGSSIDSAVDGGKRYTELPNAFKYRDQVVDGCTCNGKDHFGLAKVDIQDDSTVRKGDIIAEADGLMVAGRNASDNGPLKLSRASASIRNQFEGVPVVAAE